MSTDPDTPPRPPLQVVPDPEPRRKGCVTYFCTDPTFNGRGGLYKYTVGELERLGIEHDLTFSTFRRRVDAWLSNEAKGTGLKAYLLSNKSDHNCCHLCLKYYHDITAKQERIKTAMAALKAVQDSTDVALIKEVDAMLEAIRRETPEGGEAARIKKLLADLLAEQADLKAGQGTHVDQDIEQRTHVNTLAREGKRLWNEHAQGHPHGERVMKCMDGVWFVHNDDATKLNLPKPTKQGSMDGLTKWCAHSWRFFPLGGAGGAGGGPGLGPSCQCKCDPVCALWCAAGAKV